MKALHIQVASGTTSRPIIIPYFSGQLEETYEQ